MKPGESENSITYRTPIYLQLREIVRNKIDEGEYAPGTAIPSENELAALYGINRITVRSAVDALVNEGLLRRVQGKGVFVVGSKMEQSLEGYGGFVSSLSKSKTAVSVREQAKVLRAAGDKFANLFNIAPDDQIYYIRQLMLAEGKPVASEELYVPYQVLPQLAEVNSSVFSLHDVFAFYGVAVCSMRQSLEIVPADAKLAKSLDISPDVALIMMDCRCEDALGRVVSFSRSYTRSDKIKFTIQLSAKP